jgi:chemotaxis protein methyltransferase CheR
MTDDEYRFICRVVYDRAALVLEAGKEYLVETRLMPIVRQLQLGSITDLVARLRSGSDNGLLICVTEAMVTTETSFFRDAAAFEGLKTGVVPDLIARRATERSLNIWCAACSTGQEPYSLAILLREYFPQLATWQVSILATDLSNEVLERARAGRFSQLEVNRGLPANLMIKYFRQHGSMWELTEEIRRAVQFQEMNLTRPWSFLPRMDLILMRNVMIYFDIDTKKAILGRVARLLKPDGYLLLGGAETTLNLDDSFRRVEHRKAGYYQLVA